ncbi:5420_t:CDS:2, partial [Cetraspora pellucida]
MNNQYCTVHKSVPYEIVFGQPSNCDRNLANLIESNYFYLLTDESSSSSDSSTLVSETDSQSTIESELNNDVESSEINLFYFEEIQQDNSNINSNTDKKINSNANYINDDVNNKINSDTDKANSNVSINFNSDIDEERYSNMDKDEAKNGQLIFTLQDHSKKPNHDSYQVAFQFRMLENWYSASELELLETSNYPLLDVVLLNNMISLRQVGIKQRLSQTSKKQNIKGLEE